MSKQHKDIRPELVYMPRCVCVCVSRLESSEQQWASTFPFLEVSNLHNRQRNDYNKVFKRISMVSKTKRSGLKPSKLLQKAEKSWV